jgi:uncharacterized hydrophobic protein (TIGR00271 family)
MLLAPLMGPLVSMSMAILRNDGKMLSKALRIFSVGTGLTLFVAAITAMFLPFEQTTGEIQARLQPNLLDLGVAIISGFAAAYAHARESIQKSLPGVAVAVALMPPACVIGIGLGWFDWAVISGAALLFITNLVGIVLAGAVAFLALGFAPTIKGHRGIGVSVLLALLISVPLYQAFKNTVVYQRLEDSVSSQVYEINGKSMKLSDVVISTEDGQYKIMGELHSTDAIQTVDILLLRDNLSKTLEKEVQLDVTLRIVQ